MDKAILEWRQEWRKMAKGLCYEISRNAECIIHAADILNAIDTESQHLKFDLQTDNPRRHVPVTPELARTVVLEAYEKARNDILYAAEQLRAIPSETEDDETEGGED